jgi:glycosyltransferase involved in cell wall biosynthesis
MKIINIYSSFDIMHGATKWALSFASELVNQGHESKIICSRFEIEKPFWLKAEIITKKNSLKLNNKIFKVIANYLNILSLYWLIPKDSDVIVFHAEASTALLPIISWRCPDAKLIYYCYQPPREVYDLWPLVKQDYSFPFQLFLSMILPVYRLLDKYLVRHADKVLVWSDEYEDYVNKIYSIDCIEQLPACVDFNAFEKHDRKIRNRLVEKYKNKGEKIILMNASLTSKKRVDLLIEVLAELKKTNNNIYALVIGEGELREKLLLLAKSLNVDNNLYLLGYVKQEELPCYYFIADVLVYLEPDGAWSLSIIEAAAANLPVIVAHGGSMTTLVKDGETGVILPEFADEKYIANELLVLFKDETISKEMGERCHQHLKYYSIENAIKRFLKMVT